MLAEADKAQSVIASMRPPRIAAEYGGHQLTIAQALETASMRPPRIAAEYTILALESLY